MYKNFKSIYSKTLIPLLMIPMVGALIFLLYLAATENETAGLSRWFSLAQSIFSTTVIWVGCLVIVSFLWKKYPWERAPVKHLVIEFFAITIYVILFALFMIWLNNNTNINNHVPDLNTPQALDFTISMLITYLITCIHEAIFFYKQWKFHFSKSARLEKDNIEAKYETLKSQITPHFLFNSLNSLSMIVDENETATNYIQNLSDFLRYGLKSNNKELVLVREEVNILKKYIALQKSRFTSNLIVNTNIDEKFYHYSLPPMALQMIVENCIKHNVVSKSKPLTISIVAKNKHIIIENNLQPKATTESTGQGLKNIKDRFAFFTNNSVIINKTKETFTVEIPLLTVEI